MRIGKEVLSLANCLVSARGRERSVLRQAGAIRQHYRIVISTIGVVRERERSYDAVAEDEAFDSVAFSATSSVTTGFESLSSSLGTTSPIESPVAAAGAVLCGVASCTDSVASVEFLVTFDPPLATPRERIVPLPLCLGGIAVVVVLSEAGGA